MEYPASAGALLKMAKDLFGLALSHHQAGRLAEAKEVYLALLKNDPQHWAALSNLGVLYLQSTSPKTGEFDLGLQCLTQSLSINPNQASVHNNLANALRSLGENKKSDEHYQSAIQLDPSYLDACINRALLMRNIKGVRLAAFWLEEQRLRFSERPNYHMTLGLLLMDCELYELSLKAFERAIELLPSSAQAWYGKGNALRLLNCFEESIKSYQQALVLDPNVAEAWVNMGVVEQSLKHYETAIKCYDAALKIRQDSVNAHYNRALACENTWRLSEAVMGFERTLMLSPDYPYLIGRLHHAKMLICDWTDYQERLRGVTASVQSGARACAPFPFLAMSDDALLLSCCAQTYVSDQCPPVFDGWVPCPLDKNRRVRVGYFSADLRTHAVGFLTAGLFEAHDKNTFEVYAVSLGSAPDGDSYRERIVNGVEHFVEASAMTDSEVVEMTRAFGLDIAVDLTGHTMDARTNIFAKRIARWQVNYLGYPGSMGASYMDAILADQIVVPQGDEAHYGERVIRLPNTFQINDHHRVIADGHSRKFYGLPEDGLVLASFNSSYKLNPSTFDIWCRLLHASSNIVLWLLGENDAQISNLREEVAARHVNPERVIFAGRLPYAEHLARYAHVDLVLDTMPFNGGTSTSDALWGGAPVLTCAGNTFAARMSASLLNAAGLAELITHSATEYEKLATCLVNDPARITALKYKLKMLRNDCALFNTQGQVQNLENAYKALLEVS